MTAQHWLPGLDADEEDSGPATPSRRRWLIGGAVAAAIVLGGGAVAVHGLSTGRPAPSTATAPSSSAATGTVTALPEAPPVLIEDDLTDHAFGGWTLAPLIIDSQPVHGGATPTRVPHFDSCHAETSGLQYLPIRIRRPANWLRATVEVRPTASTPAGIGRLGFFFQAGPASTPCPDGAWSASDSFLASNVGQDPITGYVVLDRAITPATPEGRPDVFRTLQLRVSDIQWGGRPVTIGSPSAGSLCPGTRDELCAPLG